LFSNSVYLFIYAVVDSDRGQPDVSSLSACWYRSVVSYGTTVL